MKNQRALRSFIFKDFAAGHLKVTLDYFSA
jgi:hypothetical protein